MRHPAGAKAKAKAKAKAGAAPGGGRAAAGLGRRAGRRLAGGRLRRPAAAEEAAVPESVEAQWNRGATVPLIELALENLGQGVALVVEQGSYFSTPCQVAGIVEKMEVTGGETHLFIKVSGTTKEAILRKWSGEPELLLRLHRCRAECAAEAAADDLVHAVKVRKRGSQANETGWVYNLVKAEGPAEADELGELRARQEELAPGGAGAKEAAKKEKAKSDDEGDKVKKRKKEKEKKKAKTKGKKEKKDDSDTEEEVKMDGSMAKSASTKDLKALYRGTGLDPKEKVRNKVARLARKKMRKRGGKETSSSSGSSESSESEDQALTGEQLFDQSNKVRMIADACPGALTAQAVHQMKASLLQDIGETEASGTLKPVAMMYCRQQVLRRANPPAQRELLTLSLALDYLLKGRPSCAADVITQRLKSAESTINGTHWAVSQKMELVAADSVQIAAQEEVQLAQKERHGESRAAYLAGLPDGRNRPAKGAQKGKEERPDWRRDQDRGRGGRGKGRGEKPQQKDPATGK